MANQKHIYLKDLHVEHGLWLNELSFVKDELTVFQNWLNEVEAKNTAYEFGTGAQSLQDRLIRQKEVVDELHHSIKSHEATLKDYAVEHPIAIDHVYFRDHRDVREKMARFTTLYAEYKVEFMRFMATWM